MTIVFSGIGCDTTNAGCVAPYGDGAFEYIPIPEKTEETGEQYTYGSWPLRHQDGVAADLLSSVTPNPAEGTRYTDPETIRSWPVHHDPNFEALTYGEHDRGSYIDRLQLLDPDDVVGFYAGLDDGQRVHRYLIGYFTVTEIVDIPPELSPARAAEHFDDHPENAHAKRATDGHRYYDDEHVLLVDGTEPGGLFECDPIKLSEYTVADGNQRPQYYLDPAIRDQFDIVEGRDNMQFKPAYRSTLSRSAFVDLVGRPGARFP
jgi:hypothetical protein